MPPRTGGPCRYSCSMSGSCKYGERCKYPHIDQQQAGPNAHMDQQQSEPNSHIDQQQAEPNSLTDQQQAEPNSRIDQQQAEPNPHMDQQQAEPNPHVDQQQAEPNPHVDQQQAEPNPLGIGTKNTSKPQNPKPFGFGTQNASQLPNPKPFGFGTQNASQLPNPKPFGFGTQNASQLPNPKPFGFGTQNTSQLPNPMRFGFGMQNTSQLPNPKPFWFGTQNTSQLPNLNMFVFDTQNTSQPQNLNLFGLGVQNTSQPQKPIPSGFGTQNQNSFKSKRVKSNKNKWSRFSSVSGGNSSAPEKQDNQSSAPNHVSMNTVTPMQDSTSNQEQQGDENQTSQSQDHINIEANENINETRDQHVNANASVKEENSQNSGGEDEVVLKSKRQKTSTVRDDYVEVTLPNGNEKVECIRCKMQLTKSASGSTSTYKENMQICLKCKQSSSTQHLLDFQPADVEMGCNKPLPLIALDAKYNATKMRESIANWLMATEQPFTTVEDDMFIHMMKAANPMFERLCRNTIKSDCFKVYEHEKEKLKALINDASNISLTIDCWKSPHQRIEYMVFAGHFIDTNWRLQKRVLSFVHVPPPRTGLDIADAIYKCLEKWGIEGKIFSISVDNSSYNDMAMSMLKTKISRVKKLPYGGRLFHVRCFAHVLNLMVKDGLSMIDNVIEEVREAVKYINHSEARRQSFSNVAHQLRVLDGKLLVDVPTRWNSTYDMLSSAIPFKVVFSRYAKCEPHFKHSLSAKDWENVQGLCGVLKVFKACTNIISGMPYSTANMYLLEVYKVKKVLDQGALSENVFIRTMTGKMKEKFDKYWGEYHLLMAMAAVLDPRLKKWVIEFCYPKIYPPDEASVNIQDVIDALKLLYEDYVEMYDVPTKEDASPRSESSGGSTSSIANEDSGWNAFEEFLKDANVDRFEKSELQMYLEEGVLQGHGGTKFNVLDWWNNHKFKYRILSKMAIDVLAIPVSTVAFESAFSVDGRALDPYRSTLEPTTLEMLICGGDWARQLYGVKKKLKETPNEVLLPSGKDN